MADDSALLADLAEEFTRKVREGALPDVEDYARRHPGLADRIRQLFPTLILLEGVKGTTADAGPVTFEPASTFGPYRIVREVGRGGMGVVYEAIHQALDRRVALKVVLRTRLQGGTTLERFFREARTAAGLHHTNIVPVFDVGQIADVPYYAMQFIVGRGLDQLRERVDETADRTTPFVHVESKGAATEPAAETPASSSSSWKHARQVAEIGKQAAQALAYAHQRGVIHRDIKPSNLLLDEAGVLWITDFGLARRVEEEVELTHPGELLGTPRYMSPEQAQAARKPIDHRTDIYSLGATLYEILTHRPAFDGKTPQEIASQIIQCEPVPPRRLDRRVPRDLETIVLKAMAKRPEDRYQRAQDLADDLERFLSREPIQARRIGSIGRFVRWCQRNPRLAVVSLSSAAVLLVMTVAYVLTLRMSLERERAEHDAAVSAGAEALNAKKRAETQAEQSRQRLVRQYVANGQRLLDQEQWLASLPWYLEALKNDPERSEVHRTRIGRILRRSPVLRQMFLFEGKLEATAWSADGRLLALAGFDAGDQGIVQTFDPATGAATGEALKAPKQERDYFGPRFDQVSFSPDGKLLAAAVGRVMCVWDVENRTLLSADAAASPRHGLAEIQFDRSGNRLLVVEFEWKGRDASSLSVLSRQARGGELIGGRIVNPRTFGESITTGMACAFHPDGEVVALLEGSAQAPLIVFHELESGKQLGEPLRPPADPDQIVFSPDGRWFAGVNIDHAVSIWSWPERRLAGTVRHGTTLGQQFHWSGDGRRALTFDAKLVRVWNTPNAEILAEFGVAADCAVASAELSREGTRCLVIDDRFRLQVWDVATRRQIGPTLALENGRARFGPDERSLLTTGSERLVHLWDYANCEPYRPLDSFESWYNGESLAGAADSDGLALVPYRGAIRRYDLKNGRPIQPTANYQGSVLLAKTAGDGRSSVVVSTTWEGAAMAATTHVSILDHQSKRPQRNDFTIAGQARSVEVDDSLRRLAFVRQAAIEDKTASVEMWDVEEGRKIEQSAVSRIPSSGLVFFSKDGSLFVVVAGNEIVVRRTTDAEPAFSPIPIEGRQVVAVELSPDNQHIALIAASNFSARGALHVWDLRSRTEVIRDSRQSYTSLTWNRNGSKLLTAGDRRLTRVWDPMSGKAISAPLPLDKDAQAARFGFGDRCIITTSGQGHDVWDASTGEKLGPRFLGLWFDASERAEGFLVSVEEKRGSYSPVDVTWHDFRPVAFAPHELLPLCQILSGHRIDETGGYLPVDERRLFETWGEWKRIDGRSVENLAEDLQFRWNTAEAERAEAASLWSKAETHLTALIKVNDERWGLFARRGKVRHKLRRDAEAAADFSRAIELGPLNRSIWADRGTSLAELGRFREAATDFAASRDHSVEKRHPDEAWAWLALGDRDRYRRLRAEIEKDTLENSRDDVEVLAWLYAVPPAEPPLSATYFAKLAEFASEADAEVTLKRTYCAVLLRRGEVARSLAELDVLVKKYPEDEIAALLHILALARDGKEAEAKAERIVSFKRLDDPARLAKLTWQDRVAAQLLRQQITAKE